MAENKKSVVLYVDWIHTFEELTDAQAGRLIKHFLRYVNDKNPTPPDKMTKIIFEPIKQQLKRDLIKWEEERSNRAIAGKMGGIKSGESRRAKANEASASKSKQTEANEAVNVTVNVNDNVNEREREAAHKFFDAEKIVLGNEIWLNEILMQNHRGVNEGKELLHDYHLYLTKENKYPLARRQIFAGFEKWVRDEKKFNGTHKQTSGSKQGTSAARVDALKKW